jgi:hypothetical protein
MLTKVIKLPIASNELYERDILLQDEVEIGMLPFDLTVIDVKPRDCFTSREVSPLRRLYG